MKYIVINKIQNADTLYAGRRERSSKRKKQTPSLSRNEDRKVCCVPNCSNRYCDKITFHKFPRNESLQRIWLHKLRIGKTLPKQALVCSAHFSPTKYRNIKVDSQKKRLHGDAVPSRNLPQSSVVTNRVSESAEERCRLRRERYELRKSRRSLQFETNDVPVPTDDVPLLPCSECYDVESIAEVVISSESNYYTEEDRHFLANLVVPADEDLNFHDHNYSRLVEKPNTADIGIQVDPVMTIDSHIVKNVLNLISKDEHILNFTNLTSLVQFEELAALLECALCRMNYKTNFTLDIRELLLLCLMKLKLNLSFRCLAVLFQISFTTVANYFNFMLELLSQALPIPRPSQEEIRRNIPYCFNKFKNTRLVLDCSETGVESPSCCTCRIRLYSHYKGGSTVKYLIGIAPNGLITFLSDVYGGRASDTHIVRKSNVLDRLEVTDAVMTDKGFLIEKYCEERGITLIRPPFLQNSKQLTPKQAEHNENVASARVHVERAIQRIKGYSIIRNKLDWRSVNRVDKILHVICALVNLQTPIINAERGQSKKSFIASNGKLQSVEDIKKL